MRTASVPVRTVIRLCGSTTSVIVQMSSSTLPLAKYPPGYASEVGALSCTRLREVETKLRTKLQEFRRAKVLGEDVGRVVVSVYIEDVDYPFLVYFADVVIADVNVL